MTRKQGEPTTSVQAGATKAGKPDGEPQRCCCAAKEIIAIMDEERRGFDEMEVLVLASLFWRRRRQPNSKTERRQRLELR
jgi:hypothetical protein